jgi:PAS domain S-box-containing protein
MFDTAKVGIGMMSLDHKLLDANPAFCQMMGMRREELIGQTPNVVTFSEDYEASTPQFKDLLLGKIESFWGERRYQRKNGEVFWAHVTMSIVRDADANPLFIVGMLIDINEQKKVLAELHQSEARFRAMFDNISIGMALVGFDRCILAVNHTLEQISGYSAEELNHININELVYPEDLEIGADHFYEMVAGQRDSMQMERRYVRKNGEIFWARICYSLVRDQNNKPQYLVGSMEDITDRKLAADKLTTQEAEYRRTLEQRVEERTRELVETNLRLVSEIEQRQRAEEALASKAVEDAITAERIRLARDLHDAVTQTLFSASLTAEVLPELWDVDEAEARRSTEELRQLTRGALAEMRTLLLELRPTALTQARFSDLLKQLSEAVIGRARLPVEVEVEGNYELPTDIKVAFYRISQESLNNIVKYARATRVKIHILLVRGNVQMEIKDDGVGFDLTSVKPTSLGMRIMRERAEAIHAGLKIISAPGHGTTVSVKWNED